MTDVTRLDSGGNAEPARTRLDGVAPPASAATRIDGPTPTPAGESEYHRDRLPPALAERFRMRRELGRGGEANVWLCEDENGTEVAIKLFHHPPTYRTDFGTPEYEAQFRPDWSVKVYERGSSHGVFYEIMEYCDYGTLEDHMTRLGGKASHKAARDIVSQIATSLHGMQTPVSGRRLVHGDINPKNILVRSVAPLDLVLTDFGLSVDLAGRSRLSNTGKGTIAYSAPGALKDFTQAADWWSVGMTMYQVLVGRNYFQLEDGHWVSEDRIENELNIRDISLGAIDDLSMKDDDKQRWKLLLAGLLTRDRDYRWGWSQIEAWLEGQSPTVHRLIDVDGGVEFGVGTPTPSGRASEPFVLPGVGEFFDPAELGRAMAENPKNTARAVSGRGLQALLAWLTDEAKTGAPYSDLKVYKDEWGPDEVGAYFISQLSPESPVMYRGHAVTTPADLRSLADAEDADDVITKLFDSALIAGLGVADSPRSGYKLTNANWHDIVSEALDLAATTGIPLTTGERTHILRRALLLAASPGTVADQYVESVRNRLSQPDLHPAKDTGWFAAICEGTVFA
ncbi:serine/threonine protein kinase [Rhodococcus sp. 5G237]